MFQQFKQIFLDFSEEMKQIFCDNVQQLLTTTNPNFISFNALELQTREVGLIQKIIEW